MKKSHAASKPVGRSASYKRRGVWAVKKKNGGKLPVHKKAQVPAAKVCRNSFLLVCLRALWFTRD